MQLDIAHSTQTVVLRSWPAIMAAAFVAAVLWMPKGKGQAQTDEEAALAQAPVATG